MPRSTRQYAAQSFNCKTSARTAGSAVQGERGEIAVLDNLTDLRVRAESDSATDRRRGQGAGPTGAERKRKQTSSNIASTASNRGKRAWGSKRMSSTRSGREAH
eukprot:3851369-Rhodomonas_salina.2